MPTCPSHMWPLAEGNEWTHRQGLASPGLFYDAEATQKVTSQDNRLVVGGTHR